MHSCLKENPYAQGNIVELRTPAQRVQATLRIEQRQADWELLLLLLLLLLVQASF